MKLAIAGAAALSLTAGVALAQNSSAPSANAGSSQLPAAQAATAQKIQHDLQSAGFQDVNVVAESFLVQAKTKDGDPVVMTIGPHGMAMVETVGGQASSSNSKTQNGAPSSSTAK